MNHTYVALDLETTGLDPESDRIIEVGAVKFRGREVLGTFHTLVNPQRPLPSRVRLITGIAAEELDPAPLFAEIADGLVAFLGACPIVGQNISFDLSFLRSEGVSLADTVYDTFELASVLLPQLANYSLPSLAEQLDVPCPVHHRALDDAMTAKEVFLALLDRAARLDLPLLAEINRLTMGADWSWRPIFLEIERTKLGDVSLWDKEAWETDFAPLSVDLGERGPIVPEDVLKPLDLEWLGSLLGETSPMSRAFPAFEHRPGQVVMMHEVVRAFNGHRHLIVEAGTGIGKSMAYLLPAVFFAAENNLPVVISTNTINLQEQLTKKDIPDLLRALEEILDDRLSTHLDVAQLKGRNNYLCIRRWNTWRKTPGLPWREGRFLLRVLLWLSSTASGDRAELNLVGDEAYMWNRVCASEENCVVERCPHYPSGCFLYRARHKAAGAHLIVVNHALLLSDLIKKSGILPDYRYLIVDEAHHLEEEATEQLGYQVREQEVHDCLEDIGDRGGFLFHLRNYLRTTSVAASRRREIEGQVGGLQETAKLARTRAAELFSGMAQLVARLLGEHGGYERNLRLTSDARGHSGWSDVELCWENLNLELGSICAGLSQLFAMMDDLPNRRSPDLNGCLAEVSSVRQQIEGLCWRIDCVISNPEPEDIYWASLRGTDGVTLCAAPLRVGRLLDKHLFSQKDCIVLTSATLSTEGNFEYIKECLGLREAEEVTIDAPFDYMNSTMIYLPRDIPVPDRAGYQDGLQQSLVEVCRETEGRTLALFTSHAGLRTTYASVQPVLEEYGIMVLGQGIDGSPKRVISRFKANPNSLLLGAASLWEGVDVVGRALSVLVIARLPFGVPTDPVLSARSELFDDPFNEYLVPMAVLKFKQGFGRLIRSRYDRGVVVVLDNRIQTRAYGRVFLDSLPECTVVRGSLRQMPQEVSEWLGD